MSSTSSKKSLFGIKNKITLAFVVFLIIPIILLAVISSSNLALLGTDVADISGSALSNEEYRSIDEITETKAAYIDEVFTKVGNDINGLAQYASDLFNGEINCTYRESYYHNDTTSGRSPPDLAFSQEYNRTVSMQYSGWVVPYENLVGKAHYSYQNASMNKTLQISAHLDSMFSQMKTATPNYAWVYMGLQIGVHRSYPWHAYGSNYDPRLRLWYQSAVANNNSVIYTQPYIDASGLGLMITAAKTVHYKNGTLIGVVACDLTIETIKNNILNTKVLDSGYAFLIDLAGNTIAHPQLTKINTPIISLESSKTDFEQIMDKIQNKESGNATYYKSINNEQQEWMISYRYIASINFTFAVVVPKSEIIAPATVIQNNILRLVNLQIVILILVLIGAGIVIAILTGFVSKRIVRPITNLTKMMNFISQGDISREIPFGSEKKPDEITYLTASFKNLLTILRLGNDEYYRGDLNKAMSNYRQALEVFQLSENNQGLGVCANNLGNIYRIQGEVETAEKYYNQAIQIARDLHDNDVLAKRLNNLAQLHVDTKRYDSAQTIFAEALTIYQQSQNHKGMSQIERNLGLMMAQQGHSRKNFEQIEKGRRKIEKALEEDQEHNNVIGQAYDLFYLGKVASFEDKIEDAIKELEKAQILADSAKDNRLQLNIWKEMEHIYIEFRDIANAHRIHAEYESLKARLMQRKFVVFVIDVSGSMGGPRIKAAVEGALEIYDNQINPQDVVSVFTFHSISTMLLPPTQVGGNEEKIRNIIGNIDATAYQTAFYDAIGDSFDILNRSVGNDHKWIIALTDGMDNSSKKFSLDDRKFTGKLSRFNADNRIGLGEFIEEHLLMVNLIIIGLGDELLPIQEKLKALTARNDQGKFIPVLNLKKPLVAINNAFKEVTELLAQINVEDFIPE